MEQANLSLLSSKGDNHRKLAEELHTDNSDFKRLSAEAIRDCNCFAFSMPLSYSWKKYRLTSSTMYSDRNLKPIVT